MKFARKKEWKETPYKEIEIRRFFRWIAKENGKDEKVFQREAINLVQDFWIENLDDLYEAYNMISNKLDDEIKENANMDLPCFEISPKKNPKVRWKKMTFPKLRRTLFSPGCDIKH